MSRPCTSRTRLTAALACVATLFLSACTCPVCSGTGQTPRAGDSYIPYIYDSPGFPKRHLGCPRCHGTGSISVFAQPAPHMRPGVPPVGQP